MEVSMSITRRGKYTDSNICMNVQVRDVACLFFLLYANLLVLVTLCEGNHYPFIEERYKLNLRNSLLLEEYFRVMEQFGSTLSSVIDSTLGLRCRLFGYQCCEIIFASAVVNIHIYYLYHRVVYL